MIGCGRLYDFCRLIISCIAMYSSLAAKAHTGENSRVGRENHLRAEVLPEWIRAGILACTSSYRSRELIRLATKYPKPQAHPNTRIEVLPP